MKKLISILLTIAVAMSIAFCFSTNVYAATRLGDTDTYYTYNMGTHVLTITGSGPMPEYANFDESIPWFDYAQEIEKVVVGEGITTIGAFGLDYCGASEIKLPSTLVTIGSYAFSNTHNITEWDIPYGVTSIGTYAFSNSIGVKKVTLPSSLISIGARAFTSCYYLEEIYIPYSVRTIGIYAFNQCTALSKVEFQSLSANISFSGNTFTGCSSLKNIYVPKNAVCNTNFFGFQNAKTKYSDVTLYVYKNTNAYNYAVAKGFNYVLLDEIPIECGVEYYNIYKSEDINEPHHYTFTPDSTQEYCFYTVSSLDVSARLESNGVVLKENDDISSANANACIKYTCTQGQKYDLYISSMNYTGSYSLIALPTDIDSFTINASYDVNAADANRVDDHLLFDFDADMLMNKQFTVTYTDGLVHRFVYKDSYYDATNISVATGVPLACGENELEVYIGDAVGNIIVNVEHSYTTSTVNPTPDEDGYTLNSCINCDDSFKSDYFETDKTVYTLSGKCVLTEDFLGNHSEDLPYYGATLRVGNRSYSVNTDGTWEIKTFDSCTIVFDNPYGMNVTIRYTVDSNEPNKEYGIVALNGYDLNSDGYVNARDFVIYNREMKKDLCDGYWKFADNFITTH